MNIILNFLALGDLVISHNVVTYYLESRKSNECDWMYIGSEENASLLKIISDKKIILKYDSIIKATPPLFDLKKSSAQEIASSFFTLRNKLNSYRDANNTFFCEKKDYRYSLICNSNSIRWPQARSNIYSDRYNCFFSENIDMNNFSKPLAGCERYLKSILINPHSRIDSKELKENDLMLILIILKYNFPAAVISLFDFNGKYSNCYMHVSKIIDNSTMYNSINLLKNSSLYIGADSLFLHLAYYFGIPSVAVYNNNLNSYFSPPSILNSGCFLVSSNKNLTTLDVNNVLKRLS